MGEGALYPIFGKTGMGHHQNGKNLLLQGAKKWSNLHSEVTAGWCKKNCAKGQISQLSETQF